MKSSALSALGRRCQAPHISWLMERALSRPKLISLAAGFIDNETLPDHEMRLSFGNATVENLRLGVARLGAVLREAMER